MKIYRSIGKIITIQFSANLHVHSFYKSVLGMCVSVFGQRFEVKVIRYRFNDMLSVPVKHGVVIMASLNHIQGTYLQVLCRIKLCMLSGSFSSNVFSEVIVLKILV